MVLLVPKIIREKGKLLLSLAKSPKLYAPLLFFLCLSFLCLSGFTPAEESLVNRIEAKVTSVEVLQGRFEQINHDKQRLTGRFWLHKPGRVRFEYDQSPAPTLMADGVWVVIQEPGLLSQRYPLGLTPLSIFLSNEFKSSASTGGKTQIENIEKTKTRICITYTHADIPGSLTLLIKKDTLDLEGWVMEDIQGLSTTVYLKDVDRRAPAKPDSFFSVFDSPVKPF